MSIYIAGPMSGRPDFNYPAFFAAEGRLAALGFEVLNPARNPAPPQPAFGETAWQWYMRQGLQQVLQADGIALLDDWEMSRGAREEKRLAALIGIPAKPLLEWVLPVEAMNRALRPDEEGNR